MNPQSTARPDARITNTAKLVASKSPAKAAERRAQAKADREEFWYRKARAVVTCGRYIIITLPIPPRGLNPDGRLPWYEKRRLTEEFREGTAHLVKRIEHLMTSWGPGPGPWKSASYSIRAYYPTRRTRDIDNCLGSCKAILDGITIAGIWTDDSSATLAGVEILIDKENPRLEVEVRRKA